MLMLSMVSAIMSPSPWGLPGYLALSGAEQEGATSQLPVQGAGTKSLLEKVTTLTPKGWEIFDKVKEFASENLYEQINGRAEFFLAYDMIRMTFASFVNSADKGKFIDLSIFDMGAPTNAFGVFSGERSQGAPPLNLGRAGYRSDSNYYIWKGRYYIRIIASDATQELRRLGMELARKVTGLLLDSGGKVWGLTALPETDRAPESVQYFKVDAMGLDFMRNTYIALYRKGGTQVTAFLSRRDSIESVRSTVARYAAYAGKYGKGSERLKEKGVELVFCDMDGNYDVVFQKGRLMGGVSSVKDRNLAIQVAAELWKQFHME